MRTLILAIALLMTGCASFADICPRGQGICPPDPSRASGGNPAAAYVLLQSMNQPTYTPIYQPRSLAPALNCQSFGVGTSVQTTCY